MKTSDHSSQTQIDASSPQDKAGAGVLRGSDGGRLGLELEVRLEEIRTQKCAEKRIRGRMKC